MTRNTRNNRNRTARRGVTLLLVLGLMTMFAMLVVTFMVVTTQARRNSEITAQTALGYTGTVDLSSVTSSGKSIPTPNFNRAMECLLVGGLDTVIGPHSILENMYGHPDYYKTAGNPSSETKNLQGYVSAVNATSGLIKVELTFDSDHDTLNFAPGVGLFDKVGHVLTVVDANCSELNGKSTIIAGVDDIATFDGTSLTLYLVPFNVGTTSQQLSYLNAPSGGTYCYINTPAYGGTGPGYDNSATDARLVDDDSDNMIWALRPNILAPSGDGKQEYKSGLENNLILMNPDYTAPDFLNMFLAWGDLENTSGGYRISTDTSILTSVIPSFHRPYLVRYLKEEAEDGGGTLSLLELRKAVLRPLHQDHPNFTGSNRAADYESSDNTAALRLDREMNFLINGPWDVDNDGDGIQDGIWLDLGLEPVTIDGVQYKQLFSFYVIDLDGRLNVNIHGNLENVKKADDLTQEEQEAEDEATGKAQERFGSLKNVYGRGSGVSEIRLDLGLTDAVSGVNVEAIMNSTDTNRLGRYGTDGVPGASGRDDASWTGSWEELGYTMGIGFESYALPGSSVEGFGGIAPDLWGTASLLFDPLGNRRFEDNNKYFGENPYLMNPYDSSSDDTLFGYGDLEFVIRSVGDAKFRDVLLLTSLRYLFDVDNPDDVHKFSKFRHVVTTRSSDVPAVSRLGQGGKGFFEYLRDDICGGDDGKAKNLLTVLPSELLRGEKVSLDRIMFLDASLQSNKQELLKQKSRFAQEIFYLMLMICHNEIQGASDAEEIMARLAQWSVNLVDFLDADDTMTPLIYHKTDPLGEAYNFLASNFDKVYTGSLTASDLGTDYRLIWGMEQPEVALTKTFATHNRRVADSIHGHKEDGSSICKPEDRGKHTHDANGAIPAGCGQHFNRISETCLCCNGGECQVNTGSDPAHKHDESFDQVMIPQGSLFVELYRVGNPNRQYNSNNDSDSLFNGDNRLNLSKTVGTNNIPVWRLAIGKATRQDPTATATGSNNLFTESKGNREQYDFQPQQWPGAIDPSTICQVELERFIWFCKNDAVTSFSSDPTKEQDIRNRSYYNFGNENGSSSEVSLRVNDYLVIGPRLFTSFLSLPVDEDSAASDTSATDFGTPDGSDDTFISLKTLATGTGSRTQVMVAAAPTTTNAFALGGSLGLGIGVSVSEPLPDAYYPVPTGAASSKMKEKTFEGAAMGTFNDKYIGQAECNEVMNEEEFDSGFGTISCYRSVFLQRLADPGREYNEVTNPYITVDWNMIDLHVFNSESDKNSTCTKEPDLVFDEKLYFTMRQWGYTATMRSDSDRPNIWDRAFDETKINDTDAGLNEGGGSGDTEPKMRDVVLGSFANIKLSGYGGNGEDAPVWESAELTGENLSADYVGAPKVAFVHFPWNNGPLANTFELMVVPTCSPSRFGFEFHATAKATADEWWKSVPSLGKGSNTGKCMPFCHPDCYVSPYMNFFYAGSTSPLELARVFDFVRVPSRFNGTHYGDLVSEALDGSTTWRRPVYRMMEPGKINLNTANEATWIAFMMDETPDVSYTDFDEIRKGDYNNLPSRFAAPFRSSMAGDMVPVDSMVRSASDMTILRKTDATNDPLFSPRSPEKDFTSSDDKGTNQFTALEDVMRRSDLVTCRSNVFAVWVTAGYFEVEKYEKSNLNNNDSTDLKHVYLGKLSHIDNDNFDAIYPGGYVLGKEKGLDDGSVTRHRMFYIIDRTVPVGFRRNDTSLNYKDVIKHSASPD